MIKLTLSMADREIWINPSKILKMLKPTNKNSGYATDIYIEGEGYSVRETPDEIYALILMHHVNFMKATMIAAQPQPTKGKPEKEDINDPRRMPK